MQIRLGCQCGQQLITDDAYAGQAVRCPHCNLLLRVPHLQQPVPAAAPPPLAPPGYEAPPGYPQAPAAPPYQPPAAPPGYPSAAAAPPGYPTPQQHIQAQLPVPPGQQPSYPVPP